jgi:hypothetical protein
MDQRDNMSTGTYLKTGMEVFVDNEKKAIICRRWIKKIYNNCNLGGSWLLS